MNSGIEKRRHPRIPLTWPVVLVTPQGPIKGKTSNISVGGALILCSEMPEVEGEFQMTLESSEDHEISVTCEKVWAGSIKVSVFIFNGMGVRFTKISSGDYEIIASLVAEHHLV